MSYTIRSYIKKAIFFIPIFILLYNNGSNFYGYSPVLYSNPFAEISGEQWIKESPIQFFIGYFINLATKNTLTTHWIMIFIGFVYLYTSMFLFDHIVSMEKIFQKYCFSLHFL